MSESEPFDEASRSVLTVKIKKLSGLVISVMVTCLLVTWQSVFRRHDFYLGLFLEHKKSYVFLERKFKLGNNKAIIVKHKMADKLVVVLKLL